jgi:hypothetical protein
MRWSGLIKDDSAFLRHILDEINFLEETSSGIEFSGLMRTGRSKEHGCEASKL